MPMAQMIQISGKRVIRKRKEKTTSALRLMNFARGVFSGSSWRLMTLTLPSWEMFILRLG